MARHSYRPEVTVSLRGFFAGARTDEITADNVRCMFYKMLLDHDLRHMRFSPMLLLWLKYIVLNGLFMSSKESSRLYEHCGLSWWRRWACVNRFWPDRYYDKVPMAWPLRLLFWVRPSHWNATGELGIMYRSHANWGMFFLTALFGLLHPVNWLAIVSKVLNWGVHLLTNFLRWFTYILFFTILPIGFFALSLAENAPWVTTLAEGYPLTKFTPYWGGLACAQVANLILILWLHAYDRADLEREKQDIIWDPEVIEKRYATRGTLSAQQQWFLRELESTGLLRGFSNAQMNEVYYLLVNDLWLHPQGIDTLSGLMDISDAQFHGTLNRFFESHWDRDYDFSADQNSLYRYLCQHARVPTLRSRAQAISLGIDVSDVDGFDQATFKQRLDALVRKRIRRDIAAGRFLSRRDVLAKHMFVSGAALNNVLKTFAQNNEGPARTLGLAPKYDDTTFIGWVTHQAVFLLALTLFAVGINILRVEVEIAKGARLVSDEYQFYRGEDLLFLSPEMLEAIKNTILGALGILS